MNNIEKEFVPYTEALELKQLDFNEYCFATYDEDKEFEIQDFKQNYDTFPSHIVAAPTYSQAFRWFREKYGDLLRYDWGEVPHFLMIQIEMTKGKTYEEAELACLRKLIEILKQKQQ